VYKRQEAVMNLRTTTIGVLIGLGGCVFGDPAADDTSTTTDATTSLDTCEVCADLSEHGWCAASSTCGPIDGSACAWGLMEYDGDCDDPQRFVESVLPVDCRHPLNAEDPRCERVQDLASGTFGSGPSLDWIDVGGGFVDGGRLLVTYASSSSIDASGVLAVDLATGDRTIVSGRYEDVLQGIVEVGAGPFPSDLSDVQRGPDGMWYALDSSVSGAEIYRIDPASGARTVIYEQRKLDAYGAPICQVGGYGLDVGWSIPSSPQDGSANLVVGPDGTLYLRGARGGTPSELLGIKGVVALRDGGCRVVTAYSIERPLDLGVGAGPAMADDYPWLVLDGDRILAATGWTQLQSIDLATGQRTAVSSSDPDALLGVGPDLGDDFAVLGADGALWTAGPYTEEFVRVDLTTGDRAEYAMIGGPYTFADDGPMIPHPDLPGVFLVMYEGVSLVEPATGNSNVLSR
ncbi:MAG: hypothetical protein ABMB14_01955, partial [Myxococcota bacterium]